jgi:hypothetical protein
MGCFRAMMVAGIRSLACADPGSYLLLPINSCSCLRARVTVRRALLMQHLWVQQSHGRRQPPGNSACVSLS